MYWTRLHTALTIAEFANLINEQFKHFYNFCQCVFFGKNDAHIGKHGLISFCVLVFWQMNSFQHAKNMRSNGKHWTICF